MVDAEDGPMTGMISNITALNKVVAAHQTAPLDDVVRAINIKLQLAVTADNTATHHRLDAGRMLVELRRRVEAECGDWWQWQQGKFARSRKDIEKLMRIANADEPEVAAERERIQTRKRVRAYRAAERTVRSKRAAPIQAEVAATKPDKTPPPDPIQESHDDCITDLQRWEWSLGSFAGDAIAMRAYWDRQFGDWRKFEVPASAVTLAADAAKAWAELAAELGGGGQPPASAKQKLDATIKTHKRKLDAEFEMRVQSEIQRRVRELVMPSFQEQKDDAALVIRTRKGIFKEPEYNAILRCLHPDLNPTTEQKNEAFRLWHSHKVVLVADKDHPRQYNSLPTVDELMERKS
jgi:hypothetical protein